jgi:hypothetical protein
MAPLAALICFILACLRVEPFDTVRMMPLGLAFVALALLIGNWPVGVIIARRQ